MVDLFGEKGTPLIIVLPKFIQYSYAPSRHSVHQLLYFYSDVTNPRKLKGRQVQMLICMLLHQNKLVANVNSNHS